MEKYMANLAAFNRLKVTRSVAAGVYIDAGEFGELMLPLGRNDSAWRAEVDVFLFPMRGKWSRYAPWLCLA